MLNKKFVLAHRGLSSEFPENTMLAFKEAYKAGMDGIELDVQFSKDEELVVIHDERLDRTTNGKGYVKDFTLGELKELDAGSFKGKEFKGLKIPTLDEVLSFYEEKESIINIELKTGEFMYDGIEEKVLECVKKYSLEEYVFITSFNHLSIKKFKDLNSSVKYGILLYDTQFDITKYVNDYGIDIINPSIEYIKIQKEPFIEFVKGGKMVTPYTIDDLETMKMLKENGINIITNKRIRYDEI